MQDVVFQWLMGDKMYLNQIDAEDPEVRNQGMFYDLQFYLLVLEVTLLILCFAQIPDYTMLPDTDCLSVRLRVCLQEGEENPRDFTSLFDMSTQAIKHFSPSHQVEIHTALETGQTSVHYCRP